MVFVIKIIKIFCKQKHMVNMAGNSRQTSSTKMSKCNWTNELVNDLTNLVEEREDIWNAKAKVYHDKDKRKEAILLFDIWSYLFQEHIKCFFAHSHIVFIFINIFSPQLLQ
jgi:hypothetical protein